MVIIYLYHYSQQQKNISVLALAIGKKISIKKLSIKSSIEYQLNIDCMKLLQKSFRFK